ncbi:MAG: phosphatase PAP2 family protein [Rickettsia endosymbiont of Labidopullus appendiculatus]|nr:phosphatase PAP2 family protein [Rickettsia endosymbiont of Labidopullus appendiculatus]
MFYYLSQFFLAFSHYVVLIPVIIGGLFIRRTIFAQALFLLAFTIIFNAVLKSFFQVPLNPKIGKGFAFPSGHMQASVAFYGWVIWSMHNNILTILLSIVILGIGASLIYCGYHNLYDVLGGIVFAILTIGLLHYIVKLNIMEKYPFLIGYLLLAVIILMMCYLHVVTGRIDQTIWIVFYTLLGFCCWWVLFYERLKIVN